VEQLANLILYCVLAVFGGTIGISRYALEETSEWYEFKKPLAHFILTAAISVVGGVATKYLIFPEPEAIIAGGIVIAVIGHVRVRSIFYKFVIKKLGLNGHDENTPE